jgi:LPS-assembly protein
MSLIRSAVLWAALILCIPTTWAESDAACPPPQPRTTKKIEPADKNTPIEARADSVRTERGGTTALEGSAEIRRGNEFISADRLYYERPTDTARAEGSVQFHDSMGDDFYTDSLQLELRTRQGEIGPGRYRLRNGIARGQVGRIEFQGPDHTQFNDLTYTTCQEGQDDWFLKVKKLELDHEEDVGTARHATVDFFGWPVFYFPYLSFPLGDQRKSGFLFPRVGHSNRLGTEVGAPYYFNLAPNYDATLHPRLMTKRGVQLQNQFRYLTGDGDGTFEFDILPNDRVTEDDRAAGVFRHRQTFDPLWSGNIDFRWASDKDYFVDFGDRLSLTSQSYVPQTADVTYRGPEWTFITRLSDYQTVDRSIAPIDQPYARLPQIQLVSTTLPLPNQLYPQLEAEWNRFDHDARLTGERFNLNTGISLPLQNDWGFLTPKVGARSVNYRLDRDADQSLSLARGVFSVDSGLIFERDTMWDNHATVQTLEPRLFYLFVPEKNQDALPNFDTGLPDFSFSSLFRENRFNGGDRIGDANQLTAALTGRWLDTEDGVERLRLSIGRIYYFDDLRVNIPPGIQHRAMSDIVAEASAWLTGNWHFRETVQWSTGDSRLERSSTYLQYQPAYNKIFNLGYVFVRDQIGEVDLSTEWPIAGRWSLRARSLYSTHDNRNTDSYLGFEYNACCWALRVLAGRRYQDPEQVNHFMFELQLNGLSKYGGVPERPIKQGLFSFKDDPKLE